MRSVPRTSLVCALLLAAPATALQGGTEVQALFPFVGGGRVLARSLPQGTPQVDEAYEQDPYADPAGESSSTGFVWNRDRSDALPPVALQNTYLLEPGEWVFTYLYSYQSFDGLRDGRDDLSSGDVLGAGASFAPTDMTWQTHTFTGHYGFDEDWTLFASLPFVDKQMDVDLAGGGSDSFDNSGLGDMRIGVVRDLGLADEALTLGHLGLGIPTGSYDEEDGGTGLPFPMQLGTGTFALHPGFTYMRQEETWSYGMWGEARIHLHENGDDYAPGDTFEASIWAAYPFNRDLSGSLRLAASWWGDYHGESDTIDGTQSPVNEDERQGGARLDLYAGANWDLGGFERLHRLGVELGFPLDEWLDGPGMSTELLGRIGWQVSF